MQGLSCDELSSRLTKCSQRGKLPVWSLSRQRDHQRCSEVVSYVKGCWGLQAEGPSEMFRGSKLCERLLGSAGRVSKGKLRLYSYRNGNISP